MLLSPTRTGALLLGAITLVVICLEACGPAQGTGDPGDKRLNQLSADAIFASLPSGAQLIGHIEKTPAKWQDNGWFEPSGWNGPSVRLTFSDPRTPDTALAFYANLAIASGWVGNGNKKDGFAVDWTKKFSGGWQGSLGLIDMSTSSAKPGQAHTFVLNASGPAIS